MHDAHDADDVDHADHADDAHCVQGAEAGRGIRPCAPRPQSVQMALNVFRWMLVSVAEMPLRVRSLSSTSDN